MRLQLIFSCFIAFFAITLAASVPKFKFLNQSEAADIIPRESGSDGTGEIITPRMK